MNNQPKSAFQKIIESEGGYEAVIGKIGITRKWTLDQVKSLQEADDEDRLLGSIQG